MIQGGDQPIEPTLDLSLVVDRFYIFAVCLSCKSRAVAITQEFKQLITASTVRFYPTLHRLMVMDPTSSALEAFRQCYNKVAPGGVEFTDLPSHHTMIVIHTLLRGEWGYRPIWYGDNRPSDHKYTRFARDISEFAQAEYQGKRGVPYWIIDFAFISLSLDPLLPAPAIDDCLKILAASLGCDLPNPATLDKRYTSSVLISICLLTKG